MRQQLTSDFLVINCLVAGIFLSVGSAAQNIVPNAGFEDEISLPSYFGEWYKCENWLSPSGFAGYVWPYATTDYLHTDGSGYVKLPDSYFGTIHPHTGDAVMGFKTYRYDYEFREYLMNEFTEPMTTGNSYKISFWLMNGEEDWMHGTGTNHVGIYLSVLPAEQEISEPIDAIPQIEIPGIVWNTEWTYYEFYFTADADYQYITIGNFYGDDETLTELFDYSSSESNVCEYFIDDVSVVNAGLINMNASICDGSFYIFPDGDIAFEATIDTSVLSAADGSDSVIITTLTINPVYQMNNEVSVCRGEFYTLPNGLITSTAGFYIDSLITVAGCDSIIITELIVHPQFDTIEYATIQSGEMIALPDGSQTGTAGTYVFNFTNLYGCDSVITMIIDVLPGEEILSDIYIPNTFTPNGDGMNDYFFIYGEDILMINHFFIYDRWGELIYESSEILPGDDHRGWDGRFLNQPVLPGVYAYLFEIEMRRGEIRFEKGNVTVWK